MTDAGEQGSDRYVLTISCPDKVGIVAAVAGLLAAERLFITESNHFGDPETGMFFMRTEFSPTTLAVVSRLDLEQLFRPVIERFSMQLQIRSTGLPASCLIMVSRLDHCLNDLLYRHRTEALRINIPAIVSNHLDLAPLVHQHRIPFIHIPLTPASKREAERRLLEVIEETRAEFIVLARYMQVLSEELCARLAGRVVNIHHSFLPSFKGAKPYHQAHSRGVKLIGATAHFVTSDLDEGPIIEQRVEPVNHAFSADRMVKAGRDIESLVLARALEVISERRVFLNGNRTVVFRP